MKFSLQKFSVNSNYQYFQKRKHVWGKSKFRSGRFTDNKNTVIKSFIKPKFKNFLQQKLSIGKQKDLSKLADIFWIQYRRARSHNHFLLNSSISLLNSLIKRGRRFSAFSAVKLFCFSIKDKLDVQPRTSLISLIENLSPTVQLRNVKKSGKTHSVPFIFRVASRPFSVAVKWFIQAAIERQERGSLGVRLFNEIADFSNVQGLAYSRFVSWHKLATKNRAITHFAKKHKPAWKFNQDIFTNSWKLRNAKRRHGNKGRMLYAVWYQRLFQLRSQFKETFSRRCSVLHSRFIQRHQQVCSLFIAYIESYNLRLEWLICLPIRKLFYSWDNWTFLQPIRSCYIVDLQHFENSQPILSLLTNSDLQGQFFEKNTEKGKPKTFGICQTWKFIIWLVLLIMRKIRRSARYQRVSILSSFENQFNFINSNSKFSGRIFNLFRILSSEKRNFSELTMFKFLNAVLTPFETLKRQYFNPLLIKFDPFFILNKENLKIIDFNNWLKYDSLESSTPDFRQFKRLGRYAHIRRRSRAFRKLKAFLRYWALKNEMVSTTKSVYFKNRQSRLWIPWQDVPRDHGAKLIFKTFSPLRRFKCLKSSPTFSSIILMLRNYISHLVRYSVNFRPLRVLRSKVGLYSRRWSKRYGKSYLIRNYIGQLVVSQPAPIIQQFKKKGDFVPFAITSLRDKYKSLNRKFKQVKSQKIRKQFLHGLVWLFESLVNQKMGYDTVFKAAVVLFDQLERFANWKCRKRFGFFENLNYVTHKELKLRYKLLPHFQKRVIAKREAYNIFSKNPRFYKRRGVWIDPIFNPDKIQFTPELFKNLPKSNYYKGQGSQLSFRQLLNNVNKLLKGSKGKPDFQLTKTFSNHKTK